MQLRTARLCLDCEEIHTLNNCPICASEAFVFLTRWVPVDERRRGRRRPPRIDTTTPSDSQPSSWRWVRRGAAGLAVAAASRWLLRSTRPVEWEEEPPDEPGANSAERSS